MTREEAIYEFQDIIGELHNTVEVTDSLREAGKMAIEALDKCDKVYKIIDSYDADFIANYVRGLFSKWDI